MIKRYTKFIQQLAKRYIARHQPIVVGVTGSAGKSTAVTAIGTVLRQLLPESNVYFPSKQLNGELGLPLTVFQIEYFGPTIKYLLTTTWKVLQHYRSQTKPYDIIVLEYGVDHVGEMDLLIEIARPDFAIITNIDQVHFGDPSITRQEKSKLINDCMQVYLPLDVMYGYNSIVGNNSGIIKSFAIHNKKADINLLDTEFLLDNPVQTGSAGNVLIGDDLIEIISNSIESYYLIYASIGYDIARQLGVPTITQLAVYFDLPVGRATLLQGQYDSIIVDSSYNSSPIGTLHMLDIVQQMRLHYPDYGLICLMGEMRELYDLTESAHRELAQRLGSMHVDYVGLVGDSTKLYMLDDLLIMYGKDHVIYTTDSRQLGHRVKEIIANTDKKYIILVKGSQNTIFLEEAVKVLLLNGEDGVLLCRQSDRWLQKKQNRFNSLV